MIPTGSASSPDASAASRSTATRARVDRSDIVAWALIGGLVLARVAAIVVLLRSGIEHDGTILGGDARRYLDILHAPGTPYRDRAVEYTPLTLGFLVLVDRGGVHATLTAVAWSQLALELAVVALLWWAWSRRAALWYLVLGTPMLIFPFPYARVDLLSVALAVLGVALVRRARQGPAGIALAASMLAKVWPVVLLPLLVVRRRWRDLTATIVVLATGLLVWILRSGTDAVSQVVSFRGAHGWQIESVPGILAHALDPSASRFESGAWRSGAAMPGWVRTALLVLTFALVAWAWWAARAVDRRSVDPESDPGADDLAALLSVLAMLVFAPILSPQYVLWMLPFAAIIAARSDRVTATLTFVVVALTTAGIAFIHQLTDGAMWAIAIVMTRNLLLVALGVHVVLALRRSLTSRSPLTVEDVDATAAQPTFAP